MNYPKTALFILIFFVSSAVRSQTVERIIDGDTIVLKGGERIRYIGIDTPEMDPEEPYAQEATRRNAILVDGREVRLEYDEERTDRYGRTLAYVYVKVWDVEVFVNEYLVKVGYAIVATYPPNVKYRDRFIAAEKVARDKKLGVWSLYPREVPEGIDINHTIYFTKDGGEYHVAGCRYLLGGGFVIALDEAKKSLDPCEVCRPGGS